MSLRKLVIAVAVVSLITFVALFGRLPALRRTPIGWTQRLLCLHLPNALKKVDKSLTGGEITSKSERFQQYLFYEKNPVVLAIFLFLLTGSAVLFLWNAVHRLPNTLLLPVPPLLAAPYVFTYLCVSHKAHFITTRNHETRMRDYPFDNALFRPRNKCRTCDMVKPARSKHCNFCRVCVAKCDHHCPWVNNCLGRGNYRYFLALLLTLGIIQLYGAYLSWWLLQDYFIITPRIPLLSWARLNGIGNGMVIAVNQGGISIAGVGLLAAATASLPLGLLAYHVYLIWAGMTTNESQKWSDWKDDMLDGFAFKARKADLVKHNRIRDAMNGISGADGRVNPALSLYDENEHHHVHWPVKSDFVLVRTKDGRPPTGQESLWQRVWSLNDVDNIYDLGGLENFLQILRGK